MEAIVGSSLSMGTARKVCAMAAVAELVAAVLVADVTAISGGMDLAPRSQGGAWKYCARAGNMDTHK